MIPGNKDVVDNISNRKPGGSVSDRIHRINAVVSILDKYLYDICRTDLPVIIKRCKTRIPTNGQGTRLRYGRYSFDRSEHEYLEAHDGFYLLIAQCPKKSVRMQIIPAKALSFQKQRSWYETFHGGTDNGLPNEK